MRVQKYIHHESTKDGKHEKRQFILYFSFVLSYFRVFVIRFFLFISWINLAIYAGVKC